MTERAESRLIKTTRSRFEAMRERLIALHAYDVPELIAVPLESGHATYPPMVQQNVTR